MNDILTTIIYALVTAVVLPLITLAGNALIKWLGQKTKNEKLAQYLTAATSIVLSAVEATAQTFVDSLKQSGKFTAEAAAQAFKLARDTAAAQITEETKVYITENFGDFNVWLNTQIEAAVREITKCAP